MNDNNLEHRLGQGLKRWAGAGEPTLDLESFVLSHPRRRPRAWVRWLTSAAAVLLLLAGATVTFPAWAATAAAWPIIGPAIQEIIMKDAGLKWAMDAGLLSEPLAEVKVGDVTVRILGVAADQALTTVLYQVTGLPEPPQQADGQPAQAGKGLWASNLFPPMGVEPLLRITKVPGRDSFFMGSGQPVNTPTGVYGTITTVGMGAESGDLELTALINGQTVPISVNVSRGAADKLTHEYPVGQTQTVGDITYTVASVIQTPVQTVVKYRVTKPEYLGSGYSWSNHEYSLRLEAGGQTIYGTANYGDGTFRYELFPKTDLPARLVMPADVKGADTSVTWPLESGAVRSVGSVPVTLTEWERIGQNLAVRFNFEQDSTLVTFGEFEVIDQTGQAHRLRERTSGWSHHVNEVSTTHEFELPEGVQPVGIRATRLAVSVQGPWEFDLHR